MSEASSSDGARVFLALWKSWKSVEVYDRSSIEATGLGFSDFAVLEVCLHKGPLPVNIIGRKVYLTSGSITTAVDRLEAKKLVRRLESDADARVSLVELTAKGRTLIEKAFAEHARRLDELVVVLDRNERTQLVSILKKLRSRATDLASGSPYAPASSPTPEGKSVPAANPL